MQGTSTPLGAIRIEDASSLRLMDSSYIFCLFCFDVRCGLMSRACVQVCAHACALHALGCWKRGTDGHPAGLQGSGHAGPFRLAESPAMQLLERRLRGQEGPAAPPPHPTGALLAADAAVAPIKGTEKNM